MPDLIIRPSGIPKDPWSLQLRYHDCCGPTEYVTLCRFDIVTAREIIRSGSAFWLFGDPDNTPTPSDPTRQGESSDA